jgi:hypothetical protein
MLRTGGNKAKTLLGDVNKLSLFSKPSNFLPSNIKQTFPTMI